MFHVPEKFRITTGVAASTSKNGNNGAFLVVISTPVAKNQAFLVIASDGGGLEHVSVSRKDRIPTWQEMCAIKDLFWDEEDACVQFHPPKRDYVNVHENCLHIWRSPAIQDLVPSRIFV